MLNAMSIESAIPAHRDRSVDTVIGENVHRLMWRAGESQNRIADQLGMTQGALSLKLRGKRPWFAAEIDAAARHYGVTRDQLFAGDFNPNSPTPDYESAISERPFPEMADVVTLDEWRARA